MINLDKNQKQILENYEKLTTSFMFKIFEVFNRLINFFNKNKKMVYIVIFLLIIFKISSYFIMKEPKGVYEITTNNGVIYNTNSIEVRDGCIYFSRTNNDGEIIICGGFTVVKQSE
jgi:hypothetical protein